MNIYKLCDTTGYTYDMNVYFRKDKQNAAPTHEKSV